MFLNKIINILDVISLKLGRLSSLLVLVLITLISISVLLRYVFAIGFTWLQDLYIWINAIFILLGIGYTFNKDSHVRIDIIYRKLDKGKKKLINFLCSILFGLPISYLIMSNGFQFFQRSLNLNEGSKETGGLPNIYILKFFIFFMGVLLFAEILRKILKFFKND